MQRSGGLMVPRAGDVSRHWARTMDAIASALADPAGRIVYLGFRFRLLLVPMLALALWYRAFGLLIWADEVNRS